MSERDALAKKYFPKQWDAAQAVGKSKKRTQLRKAAEDMKEKERLRSIGASCANCASFKKVQIGTYLKDTCEADSDFYGYALTSATNLCSKWRRS